MLLSNAEQFTNHFGPIPQVFLDQLGANNTQESGRGLICDGFGQQSLPSARRSV